MGKVSKPKFLTIPQLTAGHNRHEAVLQQIRADIDDVTQTVIEHLRTHKAVTLTATVNGCACKPAAETGPRFNVGGLVRFRGQFRRVEDWTVIGRYMFEGQWYYWVCGVDARIGPATYVEGQLESAE